MWVLSQDKLLLVDSKKIIISLNRVNSYEASKSFNANGYEIKNKVSDNEYDNLGTYLTLEKAKKVMDMICQNITEQETHSIRKTNLCDEPKIEGYVVDYPLKGVFYMPLNSEVK